MENLLARSMQPQTRSNVHALALPESDVALARWPAGWYVVARSAEIAPGHLRTVELAGRSCVVFRTATGKLAAMNAHCPHMGAHLRHGTVVGERLRCALHGYLIDADGDVSSPAACRRATTWSVDERFGLIFLHLGDRLTGAVPAPDDATMYAWTTGRPVALEADWRSMVSNAFDMQHLCTIHHRQLIAPIDTAIEDRRAWLSYESRVTGTSPSDRFMKQLSGDRIRVRMSCYGTIIIAETTLRSSSTAAVLGLLPQGTGLKAYGAFGIRPGPLLGLRLLVTRLLFTAFLRRDFDIVQGMVLRMDDRDPGLRALFEFLRKLPEEAS